MPPFSLVEAEGGDLVNGVYGMSSRDSDCLSVEKGVLIGRTGLCSRCLEIRLSLARGLARFSDAERATRGCGAIRQRRGRRAARMTQERERRRLESIINEQNTKV